MERRASAWLAFAATIPASLLAAIVLTLVTGWGGDDLGAFLWWTFPFAGLVALVAGVAGRWLIRFRGGVVAAAAIGAIAGVLWTVVVAFLLGPFFLAFGFAVWLAWVVGGAIGLATVGLRPSSKALRSVRAGAYGGLAVIGLGLALVPLLAFAFADRPDVVAHLRSGTPDAKAVAFAGRVVGRSGVDSVTQNDLLVLEIDLVDDATDRERAGLRRWLERSPLVERVDG